MLIQHPGIPHSAADDTTMHGYTIPKDSLIFANIWAVHHDPDLWNDPEVFRPERFLDENGVVFQPDFYIPFSSGTFIGLPFSLEFEGFMNISESTWSMLVISYQMLEPLWQPLPGF